MISGTSRPWKGEKLVLRRARRFHFNRRRLPALLLVAVLCYLLAIIWMQFRHLDAMQRDLDRLQEQIAELKAKNAELKRQLSLVQSDAYIEQVARERLGLVKPGEARVVPLKEGQP